MKRGAARKPTRHISIEFESQRNIRTSYYFPHAYLNSQASYEARLIPRIIQIPRLAFQFTGLIRGPTLQSLHQYLSCRNFNSQASYEARPMPFSLASCARSISIHRPHTRPDVLFSRAVQYSSGFQFTGLIRGPTAIKQLEVDKLGVSIHRPHTRPDSCRSLPRRYILEPVYSPFSDNILGMHGAGP